MKRRLTMAVAAGALIAAMVPGVASAAPAGGNSAAAHDCQKGGYADLATSETPWIPVRNAGECTSYQARGGTAVAVIPEAAADCLDGGYADLARSATWWTAFTSQEQCMDFIAGGGVAVPDLDPAVRIDIVDFFYHNEEGNCSFHVVGTGFKPSQIYSIQLLHNGSLRSFAGGFADAAGDFTRFYKGDFLPQFVTGQTVQVRITENVDGNPPVIVSSDVVTCVAPA
jgi:hypothetical protein